MTGSSSNQDNSHMAEMAADLFEAKMAAKDASKGMTHLLKIGQFHLEIDIKGLAQQMPNGGGMHG